MEERVEGCLRVSAAVLGPESCLLVSDRLRPCGGFALNRKTATIESSSLSEKTLKFRGLVLSV